jgi:hypothetical protein
MVFSVNRATSTPDSARFNKCSEPLAPYRPVFRRPQRDVEPSSSRISPAAATPAQQIAWNNCTRSAKCAWQSWQRMPVGGYPIQPPRFAVSGTAAEKRAPAWMGRKDVNGTIHISALDFPSSSPRLAIAPGRTPLHPLVVTLDDRILDETSSVQDLEMAHLLATTLDHSV